MLLKLDLFSEDFMNAEFVFKADASSRAEILHGSPVSHIRVVLSISYLSGTMLLVLQMNYKKDELYLGRQT